MASATHFTVFFKFGCDTVLSSKYIVEHELLFLRDLKSTIYKLCIILLIPKNLINYIVNSNKQYLIIY